MSAVQPALVLAMLLFPTLVSAGPLALEPKLACGFLAADRLQAGKYQRVTEDRFECRSRKRKLPYGDPIQNEIRYFAGGNPERVTELILQLDLNSAGETQLTLKRFREIAGRLVMQATGTEMATEVADAILAAADGSWQYGDYGIRLSRNTATGFQGVELVFSIQ